MVKEQIAVELAVGRQGLLKDQPQHGLGLLDLAEGLAAGRADSCKRIGEPAVQGLPRRFDAIGRGIQGLEESVDVFQEPGVGCAGGEIEVSDDFLPRLGGI